MTEKLYQLWQTSYEARKLHVCNTDRWNQKYISPGQLKKKTCYLIDLPAIEGYSGLCGILFKLVKRTSSKCVSTDQTGLPTFLLVVVCQLQRNHAKCKYYCLHALNNATISTVFKMFRLNQPGFDPRSHWLCKK